MNRTSWMQVLFVAALAIVVGALAATPAAAGCKICGPGGCWDAGQGVSGYITCVTGNGQCHLSGASCTGGSGGFGDPENIVQGGCGGVESGGVCEPFQERLVTPGETMQLARILPETGWLQNHGQVAEFAACAIGTNQDGNAFVR